MRTLRRCERSWRLLIVALLLFAGTRVREALAEDAVCARVKMEVAQELTLERQAFDAHMRINNGLDFISLENVNVDVTFLDKDGKAVRASADPDDATALFFIRLRSLEHIARLDGLGTVSPKTSADIHWLIIPAPGSSRGVEAGTLYHVGATLTYTIGGEMHSTTVTPDHIFVKPLPQMVLDYFLPGDVYGDDPFTLETEPPVPFALGVRVKNNGSGTARNVRIDSAQPRIVDNEQGLLVDFTIVGSEVNGSAATRSMLASLGDIPPENCATARWVMTCSLTGRFVQFDAEFAHADELGGELTSLIDSVGTHLLVSDVLVDLPGRDAVRDFLATDGGVLRVYESQGVDTAVSDESSSSSLQFTGQTGSLHAYSLTTPQTAGFMLVQLSDPNGGRKALKEVFRSDGKRIKPENCRLTSKRTGSQPLRHFLSLFDVNSTGSYRILFDDPGFQSKPPVVDAIADGTGVEGQTLSFTVSAWDPDGTVPALSGSPLPALSEFTDQGDGTGVFSWTPVAGQAGSYAITFTASDGALQANRRVGLTVCSAGDSDCDGMPDSWELSCFGTLSRDGKKDFDGDGVTDFDEFWRKTDPTRSNAPTAPRILSPVDRSQVAVLSPEITVRNGEDPDPEDMVTHAFELYGEPGLVNLLASGEGLTGMDDTTTWAIPGPLQENSWYFFRVRATDGRNCSPWAYGSFLVNVENEAPVPFHISSPWDRSEVSSCTPLLEVTNSRDPDGDVLTYVFRVFSGDMTTVVASSPNVAQGEGGRTSWEVSLQLTENTRYFWQAVSADGHGASTASPVASFFVNTANDAPQAPIIASPAPAGEVAAQEVELVVSNAHDPDGDPLSYLFECDRVNTFDSPSKVVSGAIAEGHRTTSWQVAALSDNTEYFFRVRATDGASESPWVQGSFFVNTANDIPLPPTVRNPGDGAWVATLKPTLEVNPSSDLDRDTLNYRFEIYDDLLHNAPISQGESHVPAWVVPSPLNDHTRYTWRARAEDEHGEVSAWTQVSSFLVDNNGVDDPPDLTLVEPAQDITGDVHGVLIRWVDADPENEAVLDLFCAADRSGTGGILIAGGIPQSINGAGGSLLWDASGLPSGTYHVSGTIADRNNSKTAFAPGKIVISREAHLCRLDEQVVRKGIRDMDFDGVERGRGNTGLRLFSQGKVRNAAGRDLYSIWKVRNGSGSDRTVVVEGRRSGFSIRFTARAHSETFFRSTLAAGSAIHRLFWEGILVDARASHHRTYSDHRMVPCE